MKFLKYSILIVLLALSASAWAQKGIVKGRITDAQTNEPLPFVSVVINGTTIGGMTDMDGNFTIAGLTPGFVRIQASFVGYKPGISKEIQITNAASAYTEIALESSDSELEEVVIYGSAFQRPDESPISLQSIGVSEIENNAGANRDIGKVIQSLPGVASSVSFRNDVIIRGGGPSESRFYLDGIEIPNLNHFGTQGSSGGSVGILNADFISGVDFYSGAFPANRGNALSGVFEFSQKDGNKDRIKFRGTIGASEIAVTADGPIGKNTNFIFSARRSYLQFLFNVIGLPFLPTFSDYQFKVRTKFDSKNELIVLGIGALDQFKLNLGLENPTEEQKYILDYLPVNSQWNYTNGAVYKHFIGKSSQTYALSRNMLNNNSYKYARNDDSSEDNKILDYNSQEIENKFRFENSVRVNEYKINAGFNFDFVKYNNQTKQKIYANNELLSISYDSKLNMFRWALFAQVSKKYMNDRLSLSMGVRSDANDYSDNMRNLLNQISPRFSASFLITEKFSAIFNAGRYYQLPAYTTLGYRDNSDVLKNKENNLKYIQADHIIAGVQYQPGKFTQFSAEVFNKAYSNYPFSVRDQINLANKGSDFGVIGDEEVQSIGTGKAYGFELTSRIKVPEKLSFIAAYTYVRSEFADKNGKYIPSAWDNRHIFTTTLSKPFKKNWNVGFKWRFLGGSPYTPVDFQTSKLKAAWDTQGRAFLDLNKLNEERLNVFHQLDIRVDKNFFFDKWSLMIYLDIQNAYNFQAEQPATVLLDTDETGAPQFEDAEKTLYKLKTIPSQSGLLLPTIGIMIEF
ncbi:MAG TPA: TonB-dependent receptor [Bacteroidales bacterium]|nr:TonB-dependent receptor [Bacteroidales bacterium]